jgi:hypothetical protein
VTVEDRTFDADTIKRMLEFMYHGKYDAQTDDAPTKMDVLAHLFCYAIGESYQAEKLSDYAMARFDEALRAVAPKDFAELVGLIASNTEAMPVHRSLRNVALYRLDELAECKSFVNVIGGKHLIITLDQQGGDTAYRNLQAAIQLATFSANLFRVANQAKSRTAWENARLSRKLEETLEIVELFRKQVIKSSTTLHKSEGVNSTATEAIQSALNEAQQAKKDLFRVTSHCYLMAQDLKSTKLKLAEVEEKAILAAQGLKSTKMKLAEVEDQPISFSAAEASEKTELELEILQNEARNSRRALEELKRSFVAKEEALEQRVQEATRTAIDQKKRAQQVSSTAIGEQNKAHQMQREAKEEKKKAAETEERTAKLEWELEQSKRMVDQANLEVKRVLAEKKIIREQDKGYSAAPLSRAAKQQREYAMRQLQGEVSQTKRDLAQSNHEGQLARGGR